MHDIIKFRIWNNTKKRFELKAIAEYWKNKPKDGRRKYNAVPPDYYYFDFYKNKIFVEDDDGEGGIFLSEPDDELILLQYTQLNDKNNTEIFEGDIMCDGNKNWLVKRLTGGAWALDYANGSGEKFLYPINDEIEIIGNVFENPELK